MRRCNVTGLKVFGIDNEIREENAHLIPRLLNAMHVLCDNSSQSGF